MDGSQVRRELGVRIRGVRVRRRSSSEGVFAFIGARERGGGYRVEKA